MDVLPAQGYGNRVFHDHTELTIMVILASEALLRENKKNAAANFTPLGI